jgi:membrane protein YdbS with pleckstrin-like domain
MTASEDEPGGTEALPEAAAPPEHGLHPAVQIGWMVARVLNALFLGTLAFFAASTLSRWTPLAPPLLAVLVFGTALALGLWHARRLFASWTWTLRGDDVMARFGVLWRVSRSIPRVRVQHVDVSSGPIDRALGLVHVSLHVAGSVGPVLSIPGLVPEQAEKLRQALLDSAKGS